MSTAEELADQAERFPYFSAERRDLLFKAFNQADGDGDRDAAFDLRNRFISSSYKDPDSTQMVAAFAWCLARQDEDPERFAIDLWYYKWIVNAVLASARTSRQQVADLIADMDRRFTAAGASRGPVLKARLSMAERFEPDRVVDTMEEWSDSHRESRRRLNDCATCDAATAGGAWATIGDHDRAIAAVAGLLDGTMTCGRQPESTLGWILSSFRALGRIEEADQYHRTGLSLIESELHIYPHTAGHHLHHLAVRGRVDAGLDLLVDAYPSTRIDDDAWLTFLRGGRLVLVAADRCGTPLGPAQSFRDHIMSEVVRMADAFDRSEDSDGNTRQLDADLAELDASV